MPEMTYTRVFTDEEGESHFEDVSSLLELVDFAPPAPPLHVAAPVEADRAILGVAPKGWYGDWHPTPARQFYVQLSGALEAETSDGEVRAFGPGAIVLLDDTTGRGHRSRVLGEEPVNMLFVQLKDQT